MPEFKDILAPVTSPEVLAPDQAVLGPHIPPQQQIVLYHDKQWEAFVEEWAFACLKKTYVNVQRFGGGGDMGIDVAGFTETAKLAGIWDNFQCKHYGHALYPTDALPEIGKMLWFSFNTAFKAPRRYFFVAPRGVGTTLGKLLSNAAQLKARLIAEWDSYCKTKITDTQAIVLEGNFLKYVEAFDFTIFESKTALQLIADHKDTTYHVARFGGGLPSRPAPEAPPAEIAPKESRYVQQLLAAYGEHKAGAVCEVSNLKSWPKLQDHFGRQRVAFYHAESLRIFARDTVPAGTFEALQEDIYSGVMDTHDATHADGYARVCAVTKAARDLQITSNALITRAKPQDRDGMCHQLANENRLRWTNS